jgi:hypothetical protein
MSHVYKDFPLFLCIKHAPKTGPCIQKHPVLEIAVFWVVASCSASETSVNFYQTAQRNKPGHSQRHTHPRQNLKSYNLHMFQRCEPRSFRSEWYRSPS